MELQRTRKPSACWTIGDSELDSKDELEELSRILDPAAGGEIKFWRQVQSSSNEDDKILKL